MPLPKKGEPEKEYMDRCMGHAGMNSKYPDASQRAAVCHSIFAHGERKSAECEHVWGTVYPKDGGGGFFIKCIHCKCDIADVVLEAHSKGGPGSGNFGHAGRPGEVGGSAPREEVPSLLTGRPIAIQRPGGSMLDRHVPNSSDITERHGAHWISPPPPKGNPGGKAGGYSSNGLTNTENGVLGEAIAGKFGLKDLHPGKSQGPMDRAKGRNAYEVKVCTVESASYKSHPKADEVTHKLAWCKRNGMVPNTMIIVLDRKAKSAWVYSQPGIAAYRMTDDKGKWINELETKWKFHGKVRVS